jgi:hypothetical protein
MFLAFPAPSSLLNKLPLVGVWGMPVLTIFAAAWVARKVEPATAALYGLLVGFLVAVIFAAFGGQGPGA